MLFVASVTTCLFVTRVSSVGVLFESSLGLTGRLFRINDFLMKFGGCPRYLLAQNWEPQKATSILLCPLVITRGQTRLFLEILMSMSERDCVANNPSFGDSLESRQSALGDLPKLCAAEF